MAVTVLESSMQGAALLGACSPLHSAFPPNADDEYVRQEQLVLHRLNLDAYIGGGGEGDGGGGEGGGGGGGGGSGEAASDRRPPLGSGAAGSSDSPMVIGRGLADDDGDEMDEPPAWEAAPMSQTIPNPPMPDSQPPASHGACARISQASHVSCSPEAVAAAAQSPQQPQQPRPAAKTPSPLKSPRSASKRSAKKPGDPAPGSPSAPSELFTSPGPMPHSSAALSPNRQQVGCGQLP